MGELFVVLWWASLLLLVPLILAAPVGSGKRFWSAFGLSFVGIWVPFLVFVFRGYSLPDWKGGAQLGWVDCFPEGFWAQLPLVLFASCGFYRVVVLKPKVAVARWCELAIYVGALTSSICLGVGLWRLFFGAYRDLAGFMVVPIYVVVWYVALSLRVRRGSESRAGRVAVSWLGTLPFWAYGIWESKRAYLALPENPPDCFVVTASQYGHEGVVGPFFRIERRGVTRFANRQLIRFWHFEAAWRERYPSTHASFRRFYNRLGPIVARRIRRKIWADLGYATLKPVELVCCVVTEVWERRNGRS